tara:strand:- start:1181 stop:1762 length:582 start_codon:yes stop_codon:yes gene_type:complete
MALSYTNQTIELREISLKNRPKSLYEISSKGTVPVLFFNNNRILDESLDIMLWSLHRSDTNDWYVKNKNIQLEIIKRNDTQFKLWLSKYKYFVRYPDFNQDYYRKKCNEFLHDIEGRLENYQYIVSNQVSLVDIAIFPLIRQFANVDFEYFNTKYAKLPNWFNKINNSNLFLSVMKKYPEFDEKSQLIINFNE